MKAVEEDEEDTRVPDFNGVERRLVDHEADLPLGDYDGCYSVSGDHVTNGEAVLVAVGASPEVIEDLRRTEAVELTDQQAWEHRERLGFKPALEYSDIRDPEVDSVLDAFDPGDVLTEHEIRIARFMKYFHRYYNRSENPERWRAAVDVMRQAGMRHPSEMTKAPEPGLRKFFETFPLPELEDSLRTSTVVRSIAQVPKMGCQRLQDQEAVAVTRAAKVLEAEHSEELSQIPWDDLEGRLSNRSKHWLLGAHEPHNEMVRYVRGEIRAPWKDEKKPPVTGGPMTQPIFADGRWQRIQAQV